jgi:hypothetical protein
MFHFTSGREGDIGQLAAAPGAELAAAEAAAEAARIAGRGRVALEVVLPEGETGECAVIVGIV